MFPFDKQKLISQQDSGYKGIQKIYIYILEYITYNITVHIFSVNQNPKKRKKGGHA